MFSFAKRQRESGWLAVAVADERLYFAHVQRSPAAKPVLRHFFMEELGKAGAGDGLGPLLKDLARRRKLKSYRCTTVLGHGQYQLVQTEAPPVPESEMHDALSWRIKDLVDLQSTAFSFDVLPIPEMSSSGRSRQVYLAVADNRVLAPIVQDFQSGSLQLEAIDLPEMAQRNIASLFETENRGLAFLAFSRESALLTFTYQGELFAFRRIDIGAEQFAQASQQRREQLGERVALEVQRSMDTIDRQFSSISLSHMVTALPPDTGLEAQFSNMLYLPFEAMALGDQMDLTAFPELADVQMQREALSVIGAALRDEDNTE